MNKAALFFDVDGTLIDEQTKIVPESTLRALKQARENGHLVFINTGRTSCNTLDSMKHIPVDGYVCGLWNGNHLSGKCADAQYTDQGAMQTLHTGDSGVSYGRSSGSQ